jgi:hypothetical protein
VEAPPNDPEDWSEQWQSYLHATADDVLADDVLADDVLTDDVLDLGEAGPEEGAPGFRRLRRSAAGAVVGAGLLGLEQALYGERPKEEVVAEAESDDPHRDRSVFDPDDPGSATIALVVDPPPDPGGT